MKITEMAIAALAGWLMITPTMAAEDWKSEAMMWRDGAKKWEAAAKMYEDKYGWCSLNRGLTTFSGHDGPVCLRSSEPLCAALRNCDEWEVERYNSDLDYWIECRNEYIHEARDDAGCALLKIREGIDAAIEGY